MEAIQGIETGKWEFYASSSGYPVKVVVAVSPCGNKYIRTEADGREANNLLSLSESPI